MEDFKTSSFNDFRFLHVDPGHAGFWLCRRDRARYVWDM